MATTMAGDLLWDNAELVIYQSTLEDNHGWEVEDGIPKWCLETGLGSVSLWARMEDRGVEIPLFSMAPHGTWLSLNAEYWENTTREPVTDAFIEAVQDPWETTDEQHEALTEAEKLVSNALRQSIFEGTPSPEVVGVIEWCRERYDGD